MSSSHERLEHLLSKHGFGFLRQALAEAESLPIADARDDGKFLARVAAPAWKTAPLQLRLLDPATLGWDAFMLGVREAALDLSGARPKLRTDWESRLPEVLHRARSAGLGGAPPAASAASAGLGLQPPPGKATAGALPSESSANISVDTAERAAPAAGPTPPAARAEPGEMAIGIDLGTTYSVVSYIDRQGRPTSVPNANGDLLTPSVVLFDPDGAVVGKQAVLAAALEPHRVAECAKRDMGSKHYRKPINGELLPPEVVSSYILRSLRSDAERKLGAVTKAVITVPAYFDDPRRRATMDAGRLAGLQVLDILNEPTAAALAYGYQEGFLDREVRVQGDKPIKVLVFDLGGGTFDVTIVELSGNQFTALATDGDVRLGGKDWDEKLVQLLAERFRREHGSDPLTSPEATMELWQGAELAKKTLTERNKATVLVQHDGKRSKIDVTRQEFESVTAPLLERTRTTTEIVVLQAGLSWSEIDKLLLVGGSTRMPAVPAMLRELSGKEPDRSISPDEAVAQGAALYANLLLSQQGASAGQPQFSVTNVNSHSLGVVGVEPKTGRRVNAVLIKKNSALPRNAARRFKTARTNQENVRICVVEGESEQPEACTEVGTCVIRGLPKNLPAGWPIEVRFSYSENGRLQVLGKLVGHEAGVTTEFIRDNSLAEDDLMLWAESLAAEAERAGL